MKKVMIKTYRKPINARVLHERDKRRHAQSARIAKGTAERHNKLPSEHQHLVGVIGDPDYLTAEALEKLPEHQ